MISLCWLSKLFQKLISPDNIAKLIITILGVFLGYLLSARQYKKRQIKEETKLVLKYIKLIKNELEYNQSIIRGSFSKLNNDFPSPANAIDEFLQTSDLITSSITDEALPAVTRVGIIKILSLNKVIHSYTQQRILCFQISNESQILRSRIYRPEIDVPPEESLYETINNFKSIMKTQDIRYQEALEDLEKLEKSLINKKPKRNKRFKPPEQTQKAPIN
jgi:hypothetical protein